MQIWQRGTSVTPTTTSYSADRWFAYRGLGGATVSRQVTNDTTNLPFIQYCARVARNSGDTSTTNIALSQSFESINSITYAGRTVTFSFYARAGANYSATGNALQATLGSGTGTDQNITINFTGYTAVATPSATLTTTWQRFTATGTVPTNATQLGVFFQHNPTGTAGANDWFEVTGVQVDIGSVALPFRTYAGTIQGELAACQRYYWQSNANSTIASEARIAAGSALSTTQVGSIVKLPVTMRVTPSTLTYSSARVTDDTANYDGGTLIITNQSSPDVLSLRYTHGSAVFTQYRFYYTGSTGSGGYIGVSAEL